LNLSANARALPNLAEALAALPVVSAV